MPRRTLIPIVRIDRWNILPWHLSGLLPCMSSACDAAHVRYSFAVELRMHQTVPTCTLLALRLVICARRALHGLRRMRCQLSFSPPDRLLEHRATWPHRWLRSVQCKVLRGACAARHVALGVYRRQAAALGSSDPDSIAPGAAREPDRMCTASCKRAAGHAWPLLSYKLILWKRCRSCSACVWAALQTSLPERCQGSRAPADD